MRDLLSPFGEDDRTLRGCETPEAKKVPINLRQAQILLRLEGIGLALVEGS
jgi:hypothetical protein